MDGECTCRACERHDGLLLKVSGRARTAAHLSGGPSDVVASVRADPKELPVVRFELRDEAGFPGEVLPHRSAVAGVPVMHEEEIVDARAVRRIVGCRYGCVAGRGPGREAAVEHANIPNAGFAQID